MSCKGVREAFAPKALASPCELHVREALAEPFELRGASNEALEWWGKREASLFKLPDDVDAQGVLMHPSTCGMRQIALKLMLNLTQALRFPSNVLFQAAQLFDASMPHMVQKFWSHNTELLQQVLCARAAAAWMIAAKLSADTGTAFTCFTMPSDIAIYATEFSRYLGGDIVKAEDILREELELISLFKFNVHTTTIDTWAHAYMDRFDAATGGKVLGPNLEIYKHLCSCWANMLSGQVPASAAHPPQVLALGVFGLAMVALKVLPVDAMNVDAVLADLCAGEAEQVLHMTQATIQNVRWLGSSPVMMPRQAVIPALNVATMTDVEFVFESIVKAISILRSFFMSPAQCPLPCAYNAFDDPSMVVEPTMVM